MNLSRTWLRPVAAAVFVSGLVAGIASGQIPTARADTPATSVDPAALPSGGKPMVAWMRGTTLLQPANGLKTELGGTSPSALLHVKGGYVVESVVNGDHYTLVFVSYGGRKRVLAKNSAYGADVASSDGRWVVLSSDPYGTGVTRRQHVRVMRVSDGHIIAAHGFSRGAGVMAAGRGRVVVHEAGGESTWQVTGHPLKAVRTLGLDRAAATDDVAITPPASIGAKRFVARIGDQDQVRTMADAHLRPHQRKRLWTTDPGEYVLSFSPDDKRVVTISEIAPADQDAPWAMAGELRVRHARTGRIEHTFSGHFGYDTDVEPVWESDDTLLVHAAGDEVTVDEDGDGAYRAQAIVRCSVSGSCRVTQTLPSAAVLMRHKSN
ncbi:hypothetical protein P5P86_05415 [Nocardioides sp. BP30]|uniref:hypothetical protein n=1 Tax=Nocardioides sp. BP30 TaxID=3036374 RepID=UPI00246914E3|nr:hypothetical protein [Nocardioides sp. BP30]WGL53264.1 hypothetical protein P5P86_05415 [Nocardioides sp. BP30]